MSIRTTGVRYDLIARDSASRTFDRVGSRAGALERGMGRLGKAALATGAALGGGLAVGLAVSAKQAVEFQSTMTRIQTQAGGTAKDVAVLSKQVLALGKSTQQGPKALADSLYHLKSVGMDNANAMRSLKVASDLAAVGGSDLEATTNALAGAWRSGIRGAETFSKAAGVVNAVIGAGNMSMSDFVSAIGTGILPAAKTFGLSLSQVGGALALMTDEGIGAQEAATRLRMSFSLLGAPSKAADKQLKTIGLTGLQLGEAMRGPQGLIGAVGLLKDHLDASGLSAARQAQVLSRAFGGGRSSSAILTLINNFDVLRQKQDQVNNSMGKFPAAVQAQRKTAEAQLKLLESNLQVLSIQIGTRVLPVLSGFVQYLSRTALPTVVHFGDALVHRFVPVDQIRTGFSTVSGMVSDFIKGLSPKKAEIQLPTPTIKAPSTTIPNTLRGPQFVMPSPTLKVGTTRIPSTLKAPTAVTSQAQKLGQQLRSAFSGGIGDALADVDWGQVGKSIGRGLVKAAGWVGQHLADFGKALARIDWVKVGKSFGSVALPLAIGITTTLFSPLFSPSFWKKNWLDVIVAALTVVPVGRLAGVVGKLFGKVPVLKMARPLLDGIASLGKAVESPLGTILKGVWTVVRAIGSGFLTGFEKVFPGITEAAGKKVDDLALAIFGYWGRFGAAGLRLIKGLGDGIVAAGKGLGDILGRVVGWVVKPFASAGGWLFRHGQDVVGGLLDGIGRGASRIGAWVSSHVISPVTRPFAAAGSWLYGRGAAVVTGLKGGAFDVAKGLPGWFGGHVISPITGAFSKAATWLTGAGGNIISGLVSGTWRWLAGKGHSFVSWAGQIKDKIVGAIVDVFKIGSPSKVMMTYGGWIVAGLQHGMLSGKKVLHAAVKGLFHSPLEAAENLAKNGVQLPAKWVEKLLAAKAPVAAGTPLNPNVASAQQYAAGLVAQLWPKGAAAEMDALRSLWMAESGWKANAENMTSGAYGIPQALPATKMASAGSDWKTNPATQVRWGLQYILGRYGDPITAWESWNAHKPHWYAAGGLAPIGQTAWVGERGPELMQVTSKGTRIFSNRDSMAIAGGLGMQVPGYASGTVSVGRARSDVSAAQRKVNELEREIAQLRHAEATAHTKRQRKRDQLAIMAAETRLKAARAELTAANKQLTAAQAQAKRVQGVANTIQNGFLKTLQTGTASAIASAVKSINSKLQTAGYGGLVPGNLRTASRLETLANQRASLQSRISQAQQYASDQGARLGDFLNVSGTSALSLPGLIAQMTASQKTASGFASEVAGLRKRGLNNTLLGQLADAGPGSQLASLLASASASDIAQLNKLAASQQKLTTSFGQTMANALFDSGKDAGKGFLSGLIGQEKQIQAEMNKLALSMVNTIKKKLGIKSPSTVFRDQVGRQVALGAGLGVRIYTPHAVREAQRMADTMAAVRARSGAAPRPVSSSSGDSTRSGGGERGGRSVVINMYGAHQSMAEQRADLIRHMQQLA